MANKVANIATVLVVEDDDSQRRIIEYNLGQKGYKTSTVDSAEKGIDLIQKQDFSLLISDMKLPGIDGLELLKKAREIKPEMPVLFITAFGTIEKAVEAMKLGAFDYITKPFDRDEFILTIEKAIEFRRLKEENARLRTELDGRDSFSNIIGISKAMQEIFSTVKKVAPSDATILISGESGTGKELVARAIHKASDRARNQMLIVNCAAIPRDLLESELFGHASGAFTGAIKNKIGKFVLASGSTIFLDEIGDLHQDLQAKILRVLQEHKVDPLGSNDSIDIDIRVIAASNQDLHSKVQEGSFREDLFYRLNVIPIHIPPLRERPDDIPLLITHFLQKFSPVNQITLDARTIELLVQYEWPGNVRELENIIKRILIFKDDETIRPQDLPAEISGATNRESRVNHSALKESEIKLITEALKSCGWNQSQAAALLGIPRHALIYRMRKYDIRKPRT
jgi:two-component system NtrC family response regulator